MEKNIDTILSKAYKIVHDDRQDDYGDITSSFKRAAKIASEMIGDELSPQDIVKVLIAIKLSRETYKHKEDNLIDLCGYAEILNILNK